MCGFKDPKKVRTVSRGHILQDTKAERHSERTCTINLIPILSMWENMKFILMIKTNSFSVIKIIDRQILLIMSLLHESNKYW
jgi:hypothetical protein